MMRFWNKIVALKNILQWTFDKRIVRFFRKYSAHITRPACSIRRREMARGLPDNSSVRRYLDELNSRGFVPANGLLDEKLLRELEAATIQRESTPGALQPGVNKDFWKNGLTLQDQTTDSIFVKTVLQPNVLDLVTRYLGQVPYLAHIGLVVSEGKTQGNWKASQLWHRDFNDKHMCKLVIYLSEVNADSGPFTLIPADRVKQLKKTRFFPIHKTDEEMQQMGGLEFATPMVGQKLSAFFVDTYRCYHMGSRTKPGNKRIMYIATFTTFAPYTPCYNQVAVNRALSPLETLVLKRFGKDSETAIPYDKTIPSYN